MSLLSLPVSLGEALDKLTILDIKLENIKNEDKLKDCKEERKVLYEKLETYVHQYHFWYNALKEVNAEIWRLQDILRGSEEFERLAKYVLDLNDIRFRIKNKINLYSSSSLKEQKGYQMKTILLTQPLTLVDAFQFKHYLYYLSLDFDIVYIIVENLYQASLFLENIIVIQPNDIDIYKKSSKLYEKRLSDNIIDDIQICKAVLPFLQAKSCLLINEADSIDSLKFYADKAVNLSDEVYIVSKTLDSIQKHYVTNRKVKYLPFESRKEDIQCFFESIQTFSSAEEIKEKGNLGKIFIPQKKNEYKKKDNSEIVSNEVWQKKIDALLKNYNITPIYNNSLRGRATGIGDVILNIRSVLQGLLKPPIYINLNLNALCTIFQDPVNALEFRILLQRELLRENGLPENTVQYIYSTEEEPDQHFHRDLMRFSTPLQLPFPPLPYYLEKNKYIVIHTKCRHTRKLNYILFKQIIQSFSEGSFFNMPIILMGEQTFPENFEHKVHGITTVYNELLPLKKKNTVIDLTKEQIFDNLNYNDYKNDVSIMQGAYLNIHFGLGGSLCSCMNFCKNIVTFIADSDEVKMPVELLRDDKIFIYNNILEFFKGIESLLR